MAGLVAQNNVELEELSEDEARVMFRTQTYDKLGISPEEFLRRLDAGEYANTDNEAIVRLAMLAPFGRVQG